MYQVILKCLYIMQKSQSSTLSRRHIMNFSPTWDQVSKFSTIILGVLHGLVVGCVALCNTSSKAPLTLKKCASSLLATCQLFSLLCVSLYAISHFSNPSRQLQMAINSHLGFVTRYGVPD